MYDYSDGLTMCHTAQFSWTGGIPPFTFLISFINPDGSKTQHYASNKTTQMQIAWQVNVPSNTKIQPRVEDARPFGINGPVYTVSDGADHSCLSTTSESASTSSQTQTSSTVIVQTSETLGHSPSNLSTAVSSAINMSTTGTMSTRTTEDSTVSSTTELYTPTNSHSTSSLPPFSLHTTAPSPTAANMTTSTSVNQSTPISHPTHRKSTPAIVGSSIGGFILIFGIIALLFWCRQRWCRPKAMKLDTRQILLPVDPPETYGNVVSTSCAVKSFAHLAHTQTDTKKDELQRQWPHT